MDHPWKSSGEKRTLIWSYEAPPEILAYLKDLQEAIAHALQVAYRDALRNSGRVLSPIALRREVKTWFYSRYSVARYPWRALPFVVGAYNSALTWRVTVNTHNAELCARPSDEVFTTFMLSAELKNSRKWFRKIPPPF